MARLKQEWKAQMKNKQQASAHNSRPRLVPQQQSPPQMAAAAVSANCIDLTIDDDSEDDDEPLVPVSRPQAQHSPQRSGDSAAAVSSTSSAESVHGSDGNDSSNGRIFEGEPVESDVDEEWPQPAPPVVQHVARAPMRQLQSLSFSDDEDQESEEDEELPKRQPGSPAKRPTGTMQSTSEAHATVASAQAEDRNNTAVDTILINAAEDVEKGTTSASPANSDASLEAVGKTGATSEPVAKKRDGADDDEYLEDGEIFEEGAVPASPTKVKEAIALERMASRASLGDSASPLQPQQRQKKQKKRGKKKSKRKLEAMLMMGGAGAIGGSEFEFERNTRHQPFMPPTATLDQHMAEVDNMMMMYGGPPPAHHPGNANAAVPPGYGAHPPSMPPPPPHLHLQGPNPPMPSGPPEPSSSSGPFPAFADDQILRVNRHGNVEMFHSNVDFPRNGSKPPPLPPQPPAAFGGFKYRSIPPQPPRAPALSLAESNGSSSTGGSSSSSASSSCQSPEKLREERGVSARAKPAVADFDLDSLRAAALRTKRLSMVVSEDAMSAAEAAAVGAKNNGSPAPPLPPAQVPVSSEPAKKNDVPEPSIEDLRAEILRSMMLKKKAARSATVNAKPSTVQQPQSPPPAELETAPEKVSSPVSVDQQQQAVDRMKSNAVAPELSQKDTPSPPPPTVPEKPSAPIPSRVDYSSLSVSTAGVPPKFRPLTASSQSIVICLSPEDYVKSSTSGSGGGASGSSSSSTIQSAITEMRKKIAEKEKLRKESRSGAASEGSRKSTVANAAEKKTVDAQQPQQQGDGQQAAHADTVPANTETAKKTNPETMSSLQARIEAMKKQIAAKEIEKSNGASSTSSSTRASASSSPLNSVKKSEATGTPSPATNGVSTACVPTSTSTAKTHGAAAAAADGRPQQNAHAALAVPYVST